jgi:DUF3089 family protein
MRPQLFVILAVTLSVTGTEYGRRLPTALKAFLQLGSSNTVSANDYSAPNTWLCCPRIKGACNVDMTTTVVAASGALTRESWKSNANAPIDCFYVYPTVSTDPTPNSDMNPDAAELNVIRQQFARFGSVCRLYAPIYRQITLAGLRPLLAGGTTASAFEHGLQYDDIRDAWNYYLEHENGGRGFVLIGHSQGAFILTTLIRNEIDGKPVSSRMVSAILMGTTLTIPRGKDVGGTFQHVPLCHSPSATGCVITYASFRSTVPPPANTLFGKVAGPNMVAACTNPAALSGGSGELHAYLDAGGETIYLPQRPKVKPWVIPERPVETPWVSVPSMLTARCATNENATYLEVSVHGDPSGKRVADITGDIMAGDQALPFWGLHLIDVNLAMGNLVQIVGQEAKSWVAAQNKK